MIEGRKKFNLLAALIIALFTPIVLNAQPGTWATSIGGPLQDYAEDVLADAAGNVYVCGNFRDTLDFGSGVSLAAAGATDVFLAKYDASGQVAWARGYGWFENEFSHSLGFDPAGNVVMVGEYQDSTIFTNDTIFSLDTLWYGPYAQTYDIFILRVDPNGNQVNVVADGWFGSENAYDVEIDDRGFVIFAGMFRTYNQWIDVRGKGYDEIMLMVYDTAGDFTGQHGGGAFIDRAQEVEIVNDSNYILAGVFQDTCYFKDSTVFLVTDFNDDAFVAYYDDTLALSWVKQIGGPGTEIIGAMETDASGNIYVAGTFSDTLSYPGGTLASNGELDGFVIKMDLSGNVAWAQNIGDQGFDGIRDLELNPVTGDLLVVGYFQGSLTLANLSATGIDSVDQEAYLLSVSPQGAYNWLRSGGGNSLDAGVAVSHEPNGFAYVLGTFNATATFSQASLVSNGSEDLFLLRVRSDGAVSAAPEYITELGELIAYPNPARDEFSLQFSLERPARVRATLLDLQGRTVRVLGAERRLSGGMHTLTGTLFGVPAGMYLYRVEFNGQAQTGKLIIH
ncbi:MAG: T9SS type A sorting domain-containing protein [Bacteroidota bacterium]